MSSSEPDQFSYRSKGGSFSVGSEEGDNMSAFVKVDDKLLCITRKNTRSVVMADEIDPDKTNPNIGHNVQHILPYGSDSEFVGKTLQQASVLFAEHSLPQAIDHNKGISIGFSFLKEITALDKTRNEYLAEENSINSKLSREKSNRQIPSFPNLDQKIKAFITNSDHSIRLIMEMSQLFYPEIKNKGWEEQLYKIVQSKLNDQDPFVTFIKTFKEFTEKIRKIRNTIEHPDVDNFLTIENYKLTPQNIVDVPSICFKGKECELSRMKVYSFMESTVTNLLKIFELLMVYLCNLHAEPFAGDKRVVVSVPQEQRQDSEKHMEFQYQILWTK